MLKHRVASAVVLAPLFLALVYAEFPYFNFLAAGLAGCMAWEFARMDGKVGRKRFWLVTAASVLAVGIMSAGYGWEAVAFVIVAVFALVVSDQMAGRKGVHMVQIAPAYAALPTLALLYVMGLGGHVAIFWLLAIVWATDIGAYFCGRLIGGPKLAPRISPNKTWSGAVGGVVWAVIASSLLLWAFHNEPTVLQGGISILISIVSQIGDLFESKIKRQYNVKDSGSLIPGHGGVMDRFDGLWAAAPMAALFCAILGGGVQTW